jgi:hypothetical protein
MHKIDEKCTWNFDVIHWREDTAWKKNRSNLKHKFSIKICLRMWTKLICLRIWASDGRLWKLKWTFELHKIRGISWMLEQLLAYQRQCALRLHTCCLNCWNFLRQRQLNTSAALVHFFFPEIKSISLGSRYSTQRSERSGAFYCNRSRAWL